MLDTLVTTSQVRGIVGERMIKLPGQELGVPLPDPFVELVGNQGTNHASEKSRCRISVMTASTDAAQGV